jgi:hypothetical protein
MRELEKDRELEEAIRSLKSLKVGLTDASRRRVAVRCKEVRPSFWGVLGLQIRSIPRFPVPVAAGAMALLLAVGLTAILIGHQIQQNAVNYGDSPVRLVSVVPAESGGVTLEWRDGPQRTYTVLKSTNPRNFKKAESYAVHGTRWTDTSPAPGQVVYYRVQ